MCWRCARACAPCIFNSCWNNDIHMQSAIMVMWSPSFPKICTASTASPACVQTCPVAPEMPQDGTPGVTGASPSSVLWLSMHVKVVLCLFQVTGDELLLLLPPCFPREQALPP